MSPLAQVGERKMPCLHSATHDWRGTACIFFWLAGNRFLNNAVYSDLRKVALSSDSSVCNACLSCIHSILANYRKRGCTKRNTIQIEMHAPLHWQVHLLKELRPSALSAMEISSVDGFQGREKEAIIICMVSRRFLPSNSKNGICALSCLLKQTCSTCKAMSKAQNTTLLRELHGALPAFSSVRQYSALTLHGLPR